MSEDRLPVIHRYSRVKMESLDWLWPYRFPIGKLTLLVGNAGKGKSILSCYMAAQVSRGARWPDCPGMEGTSGSTIILSTEDAPEDTIVPRVSAHGADLNKVIEIKVQEKEGKNSPVYDLVDDLEVLEHAVEYLGDVRLVILDPITAYMGGKNENSNAEVREFVAPLCKLAEKHRFAIIGISHLNKKVDVAIAQRTLGSTGWNAAARVVWLVAEDEEDEDKRYLLYVKGNLGKKPTGLAFWLRDAQVLGYEEKVDTVVCKFDGDPIELSPDEAMAGKKVETQREKASKWILEQLKDGAKEAAWMVAEGEKMGLHRQTMDKAKQREGIRSKQMWIGGKRKWIWYLEEEER